jgi:type I restriction enzyme S subunit
VIEIQNEWLSDIPTHWKILKFKHIFKFEKEVSYNPNPTILSLTLRGIQIRDTSNNEGQLAASYEEYALVKPGNFVLNPMDLISGSVAISSYEGVASNAYFIFSIKERKDGLQLNARYFEYLFWSHYRQGIFFPFGKGLGRPEQGGGRWTLNRETLSDFPIPVPPIDEQNLIVEKLDGEFARIAEQLVLLEKMTEAISKEKLSISVQELYKKKVGK